MNLVFGTNREPCELKSTGLDTPCISVFVPNPPLLCTVFPSVGFDGVRKVMGACMEILALEGIAPAV